MPLATVRTSPALVRQTPGLVTCPYAIFTGRGGGSEGQDVSLGHTGQGNQATLIIQVALADLGTAEVDLLGLFEVKRTDPIKLSRLIPAKHPFYQQLYCNRITGVKGVGFEGKYNDGTASPWDAYHHYLVSCLFTQPHYRIISDEDLDRIYPPVFVVATGKTYRQEWQRWTFWQGVASVEAITREAGTLAWAEGGGAGPVVGSAFNSPFPRFLQKQDIVCRWFQVPLYRGLYSSDAATKDRPINLEAGLYKVNELDFYGYPAGTLLFRGWQITPNEAPSGTTDTASKSPLLTADVDLSFTFFDPPEGGVVRGHNLAPHNPAGATGTGKWYLVVEKGTTKLLFDQYPFERLFTLPG